MGIILLVLLSFNGIFYSIAKIHFTNYTISALKSVAEDVFIDDIHQKPLDALNIRSDKYAFGVPNVFIQVFKDGNIVAKSLNLQNKSLPIPKSQETSTQKLKVPSFSNYTLIVYTDTMGANNEYTIQTATTTKNIDEELKDIVVIFLALDPLVLFFIFFISTKMLKDTVRPMIAMMDTVNKISMTDLSKRIPKFDRDDEFSQLGETFNAMLDKMMNYFYQIKRFNANTSHELKTPLTTIRLQIDVALKKKRSIDEYEEILRSINEETKGLQSIIENLLLITQMENKKLEETFVIVDLDTLLLKAIDDLMPLAQKKSLVLDIGVLEHLTVKGIPSLLLTLFLNILENAIKYTPKGKKVIVSLEENKVIFEDNGVGIDENDMPNIFDRFFQANTAKQNTQKGYGLGLSIAQKIASLHGAHLSVQSKIGIGTKMTIEFQN